MVASDSFANFLREQLAPLGRITVRRKAKNDKVKIRALASKRPAVCTVPDGQNP